jgi:hypothetical protein
LLPGPFVLFVGSCARLEQQRDDDHDDKWRAEKPSDDSRHGMILSFMAKT